MWKIIRPATLSHGTLNMSTKQIYLKQSLTAKWSGENKRDQNNLRLCLALNALLRKRINVDVTFKFILNSSILLSIKGECQKS